MRIRFLREAFVGKPGFQFWCKPGQELSVNPTDWPYYRLYAERLPEPPSEAPGLLARVKAWVRPSSTQPHPCPQCAALYSTAQDLAQHVDLCHPIQPVECPYCLSAPPPKFKSEAGLARHVHRAHPDRVAKDTP